jgi:maltose alpha-D-glucosyltransferase / alpha-amylase
LKNSGANQEAFIDFFGVLNHPSDQHPWFQKSRSDPSSKYRDYYVWREDDPGDTEHLVIFPGHQDTIWTYDKKAGAYYQHRFYHHQPDLNTSNPEVRAELKRIIDFWLQLGISGFRVDAVPFLIESGDPAIEVESCFEFLDDIREFISWRKGDAVMLAEVDVAPTELENFFGDGRRLHLIADFMLNRYLYLALADESAEPLERIVRILPKTPRCAKWANFVRNHDELSIGFLTESARIPVDGAVGHVCPRSPLRPGRLRDWSAGPCLSAAQRLEEPTAATTRTICISCS